MTPRTSGLWSGIALSACLLSASASAQEILLANHLPTAQVNGVNLGTDDYLGPDGTSLLPGLDDTPVSTAPQSRPPAKKTPSYVSASSKMENWVVVAVLGATFSLGLIITASTLRRYSSSEKPTRIF
jgi:hypothetical protein